MKKIMFVVSILLLALGVLAFARFQGVETCSAPQLVNGNTYTTCTYVGEPNLPVDQMGGYSFAQVTGLSLTTDGDSVTLHTIAPDLGTLGSFISTTGEVTGFYWVKRAGGDVVYYPTDQCDTQYQGAVTFTTCYYDGVPVLPTDQYGGYSLAQVTGMRWQGNDTGGFDQNLIRVDTGLTGSLYTTGPMNGNVAGFYGMVRLHDGQTVYFPIGGLPQDATNALACSAGTYSCSTGCCFIQAP